MRRCDVPPEVLRSLAPSQRERGASEASAAGDVAPGDVLVDARFGREAEHALADDVALDLGRATLDRVGPAAQEEHAGRAGRADVAEVVVAAEPVVGADEGVGAEQVDAQLVDPLVDRGERQLGDRALRARACRCAG